MWAELSIGGGGVGVLFVDGAQCWGRSVCGDVGGAFCRQSSVLEAKVLGVLVVGGARCWEAEYLERWKVISRHANTYSASSMCSKNRVFPEHPIIRHEV